MRDPDPSPLDEVYSLLGPDGRRRHLEDALERAGVAVRDGLPDPAALRGAVASLDRLYERARAVEMAPAASAAGEVPVPGMDGAGWDTWEGEVRDAQGILDLLARSEELVDQNPQMGSSVQDIAGALADYGAAVRNGALAETTDPLRERYDALRDEIRRTAGAP
jgi:hypothetical protein